MTTPRKRHPGLTRCAQRNALVGRACDAHARSILSICLGSVALVLARLRVGYIYLLPKYQVRARACTCVQCSYVNQYFSLGAFTAKTVASQLHRRARCTHNSTSSAAAGFLSPLLPFHLTASLPSPLPAPLVDVDVDVDVDVKSGLPWKGRAVIWKFIGTPLVRSSRTHLASSICPLFVRR
jgi:hypothetical protein